MKRISHLLLLFLLIALTAGAAPKALKEKLTSVQGIESVDTLSSE